MKASYPLHINPASTNANPPIIPPLQKLPRQPHLLRKVRTMVFEMLMQHMQKFLRTIFNIAIKGLTTSDFGELRKIKELYDAVLADLHNECKKSRLSHLEKIVAVAFIVDPWTPDNGCLTAANKLQRRAVIAMHQKEFEETRKKGIF